MKNGVRLLLAVNATFFAVLFCSNVFSSDSVTHCEPPSLIALLYLGFMFAINIYYIMYHEHVEQWSGKVERRMRRTDDGSK